jgi:hypothetical protein
MTKVKGDRKSMRVVRQPLDVRRLSFTIGRVFTDTIAGFHTRAPSHPSTPVIQES